MSAPLAQPNGALPELQQDLRLVGSTMDFAGNRLWKIYDPLRHRYTALGEKDYAMLAVWSTARSAEEIIEACWHNHAVTVASEEVADFAMFLIGSGLATRVDPGAWRATLAATEKYRSAYLTRLLHNYLFFRIPVVNPEQFLRSTLPLVRGLGTRAAAIGIALIALTGLFLVSREWDEFTASVLRLPTVSGAAGVLVAIAFVKLFHELGHGYTAINYGCRVPTLGIAFILGAPLLYVDATDGWKLQSRAARTAIDAAGIAVDLSIAAIATLVWVFLPDGAARNAAFSLATAGWVTSLVFNLNPFMKFDGYHLLADWLGIPNLQDRSIVLARWRLRELLFGIGQPAPERVPPSLRRHLVAFGWCLWIYRAVLFTAIAIVVYYYFFKLLGIILFAVEIGYFIIAPMWREAGVWMGMRSKILASRRAWGTAAFAIALLAVLAVPWSTTVTVPAVLEPVELARLHISVPARITSIDVASGASVSAGTPLMKLTSTILEQELLLTGLKAAILDLRLARLASDSADREMATIIQRERWALAQAAQGIRTRIDELNIVSPKSGQLSSLVEHAAPLRWVVPAEPLAVVHGDGGARVRGLVEAADSQRLRPGMGATFIPNDFFQPSRRAVVTDVATANATTINQLELAESFGGQVPTRVTSTRRVVPLSSQYAVTARLEDDQIGQSVLASPLQPQVGVLLVHGDPQSLLLRLWNRVLLVLVRESGF